MIDLSMITLSMITLSMTAFTMIALSMITLSMIILSMISGRIDLLGLSLWGQVGWSTQLSLTNQIEEDLFKDHQKLECSTQI